MYIKVLNPKSNGKKAYDNAEKSAQSINYLVHEAKENGQEATFFTQHSEAVASLDVQQMLDSNVKGLGKSEAKFYSLVISPSAEELELLGNSPEKLRDYTREVMRAYADNFTFKDGKKVGGDDLVWAATQHNERLHRGDGVAAQLGEARSGQPKEGLQTHIHVVVSARNSDQTITLNPMSKADRFDRTVFAAKASVLFTERFGAVKLGHAAHSVAAEVGRIKGAKPPMSTAEMERREHKIGQRVEAVNQILPVGSHLDAAQVFDAGRARQYDRTFYTRLSRIEAAAAKGLPVANPYELLSTGRVGDPWRMPPPAASTWREPALSDGLLRATNRDLGRAASRLAAMNRSIYTQDISGDRDKDHGGIER